MQVLEEFLYYRECIKHESCTLAFASITSPCPADLYLTYFVMPWQALERYKKSDAAQQRDLELSIEKLAVAVAAARDELEREVTETQAAQTQLDRTAEDFRCAWMDGHLHDVLYE
jgi:hypothetical protein